jgi:hypothetical protein
LIFLEDWTKRVVAYFKVIYKTGMDTKNFKHCTLFTQRDSIQIRFIIKNEIPLKISDTVIAEVKGKLKVKLSRCFN